MAGEQIEAKAVELIGKLEALAPQATQVALDAVRITAWGWIIAGVVHLLLAIASLVIAAAAWPKAKKTAHETKVHGHEISFLLGCGAFLLFSVLAASHLLSPWTYAALTHPEVWLAKKALGL